ncbi:hypothetical protein [Alkalihalobacillus pseudalcaliphilus]|uniref:hypothetical protein n=1 Tax=Alkalihalobacillus pseudalcaliphilus TaxID=79884 RepID=UPI00064DD33C|nr:hypothetical protein [Alkalihalobacillus pseudalcaliphilus]
MISWRQEDDISEIRKIVSTVNRGVEIRGAIDSEPSYYLRIQENSSLAYIVYVGVSKESDGYGALIVHEDDTSIGYQLNTNRTEALREILFQGD